MTARIKVDVEVDGNKLNKDLIGIIKAIVRREKNDFVLVKFPKIDENIEVAREKVEIRI